MKISHPDFIVGIGGSAGSLSAFTALFEAMPIDTGMAFIVVMHLQPESSSILDRIISNYTLMPVVVANTGMTIQANRVYVIPPNSDLFIDSYTLKVISPPRMRSKQVDCLFISLAESITSNAIGIILSGYLNDGTAGCKHIKGKGGITFAQDESAEAGSMPLSAIASGYIDFVLSPRKIPGELLKQCQPRQCVNQNTKNDQADS
jgi:two-component system CheB/CheR fusion protein